MGIDEQQLQEIEARANEATPGPWKHYNRMAMLGDNDKEELLSGCGGCDVSFASDADGQFTANARTDVPLLVAEVRRLQEENAKLKQGVHQ